MNQELAFDRQSSRPTFEQEQNELIIKQQQQGGFNSTTSIISNNDTINISQQSTTNLQPNMNEIAEHALEKHTPVVFTCTKCRTIVGDSYAFENRNKEWKIICLSGALNISIGREPILSQQSPDEGW